jgi:hypothetical protein
VRVRTPFAYLEIIECVSVSDSCKAIASKAVYELIVTVADTIPTDWDTVICGSIRMNAG